METMMPCRERGDMLGGEMGEMMMPEMMMMMKRRKFECAHLGYHHHHPVYAEPPHHHHHHHHCSPFGQQQPPPLVAGLAERSGHWSTEEEAYAEKVAELFKSGNVPNCPEGTTSRALISGILNCAPMRVSKKFTGDRAIGKQFYKAAPGGASLEALTQLKQLEEAFHASLRGNAQQLRMSLLNTSGLMTPVDEKAILNAQPIHLKRSRSSSSSDHGMQGRTNASHYPAHHQPNHGMTTHPTYAPPSPWSNGGGGGGGTNGAAGPHHHPPHFVVNGGGVPYCGGAGAAAIPRGHETTTYPPLHYDHFNPHNNAGPFHPYYAPPPYYSNAAPQYERPYYGSAPLVGGGGNHGSRGVCGDSLMATTVTSSPSTSLDGQTCAPSPLNISNGKAFADASYHSQYNRPPAAAAVTVIEDWSSVSGNDST